MQKKRKYLIHTRLPLEASSAESKTFGFFDAVSSEDPRLLSALDLFNCLRWKLYGEQNYFKMPDVLMCKMSTTSFHRKLQVQLRR